MAIPEPSLWLHAGDGTIYHAWAPPIPRLFPPAGTPVELYLDRDGNVNGWRESGSRVGINQRRLDQAEELDPSATLLCQGDCRIAWRAPAAAVLAAHDERCLTCAGPLVLR